MDQDGFLDLLTLCPRSGEEATVERCDSPSPALDRVREERAWLEQEESPNPDKLQTPESEGKGIVPGGDSKELVGHF
jgi:hypothetical protein